MVAGVVGEDVGAEGGAVEVDVDLCGGDGFMPEHFLDCTQVGATFQKVGGKGVAQSMGGYGFTYPGTFRKVLHYLEYPFTCEMPPAAVKEENIIVTGLYREGGTVNHIVIDFSYRCLRHRHHPLFTPFTHNHKVSLISENF